MTIGNILASVKDIHIGRAKGVDDAASWNVHMQSFDSPPADRNFGGLV